MPSAARSQGPLDHLGLAARTGMVENAGVNLRVLAIPRIIELRGTPEEEFLSAVRQLTDVTPPKGSPQTALRNGLTCFWMGPDRWWLISEGAPLLPSANELRQSLAAFEASAVEIGEAFTGFAVSGPNARDVLAKGCTIDLHPRAFHTGAVVQTNLGKAQVALFQIDEDAYRIYIRRSFAEYLWLWLEDAAAEYAFTIHVD